MNLNLREFAAAMKFFSKALINSKLPKGLWQRYIILYGTVEGAKQRISHETLAKEWSIEIVSVSKVIKKLREYNVILATQESDPSSNDNYGYLFLTPLVHPKE